MLHLRRVECLGEALRDSMITHKSNVALFEAQRHRENGRWTFLQMRSEAERVAVMLRAAGVQKGDRVAILMQNQAKWLLSATGALWCGAILVPLDYKLTAREQGALLAHNRPAVLITEFTIWTELVEHLPQQHARVFVTEAPSGADLLGAARWEQDVDGEFEFVARSRQDVACIVYSSGTGGTPKGCQLTHDNYLEQAQILAKLFPITEEDRYFSILPTNHAIDFMCGYILPLLFGAAVVHQRTLRPQFLGPTMKRYQVSQIALVPTILKNLERRIQERLDELPRWQRRILDGLMEVNETLTRRTPNHALSRMLLGPVHEQLGGNLKRIFAGGAFVERSTADFFYRLGIPVVIGYGVTEATTVITVNDLKPYRSDSVGKPVAGVEVRIRDENEQGVGEVCVKGRTVMRGYFEADELTHETIVDGWLRTGDLGTIDASGHLKLLGRSKNMIVTAGGKNIYPEDVETYLEDLPDCEECCVFAANYVWPSQSMVGEQLIVVLRCKGTGPSAALIDELRVRNRKLADFKRLSGYLVHGDEFPRTASMKVKREALAAVLREHERIVIEEL